MVIYLSDPIEATWGEIEHETFALLADRIEDMLNAKPMAMNEPADLGPTRWELATHDFDEDSLDCLMQTCYGPCLVDGVAWTY